MTALLTIYKPCLRPHLTYGDNIYDRAFNESFQNKLESLQYNAALAITGAIRGSLREKPWCSSYHYCITSFNKA